ncbi:MAG: hypothetical protein QXE31_03960 [Candidatus Woesearchaeota archaeon]
MKKAMKKAESQYISWILIFGMVIMISYFLFNWTMEQAKKTAEQIETTADPLICEDIGFSLNGICQKGNKLFFNVSNTNTMIIEGFVVKTEGLYPEDKNYLNSINVLKNVQPTYSEEFFVFKKGTLKSVELMPFAKKSNKYVYCEQKSVKKSDIKQC